MMAPELVAPENKTKSPVLSVFTTLLYGTVVISEGGRIPSLCVCVSVCLFKVVTHHMPIGSINRRQADTNTFPEGTSILYFALTWTINEFSFVQTRSTYTSKESRGGSPETTGPTLGGGSLM